MKLSSLFSFFGSFWGKICLFGLIGIAFWVLKIKLDTAKAKLEANQILITSLENSNKNQKNAIQILLEQQQKQNDAFSFLQQKTEEKQKALTHKIQSLQKIQNPKTLQWKKQEIPQDILQVLKE